MGIGLLAPASRLPPELLVKIFKYLAKNSNPTILLRVCHRWADIASSVSSLWSRIDFSTPPGPFLNRISDQPIEVNLSSPVVLATEKIIAAKQVLYFRKNRIRKLVLDLPTESLSEIESELSEVFPTLEDVSISASPNPISFENFPDCIHPETPSLIRRLRLLLVGIPWAPGHFRNLVELVLHSHWQEFDPPMEEFLRILESSPQLVVLSMANAGPRLPTETTTLPPATRVVHLPNLQQLYLEQGDPCDVGWVLIHLTIPLSANVRIFVDFTSTAQIFEFPLELAFDLILPKHSGLPHLANPRCCAYVANGQPTHLILTHNFALGVTGWSDFDQVHCEYFLLPFLRRAAVAGMIEDMDVTLGPRGEVGISRLQWKQIFGTTRSLRKLRIYQSRADEGFSILDLLESQQCRALRELQLSSAVLCRIGWTGEERATVTRRFVDCCAERDRSGSRLERLVIDAPSNAFPDLASLLAPYVDYVEITEGVLWNEDIRNVEFGSRQVFDSLQACRYDEF